MKKHLLSLAILCASAFGVNAQPDMGFETWANVPLSLTVQDPVGWASFNSLTATGMTQSVFKETTAPHAGSASAKIVTELIPGSVSLPNPFDPKNNLDTAGILGIGKTALAPPYVTYGFTYASRPAQLNFACKYNPNPNNIPGIPDTAYVVAYMTKWNGTSRDTIGTGEFKTWLASTTYSAQTINMTYSSSAVSDTQLIVISSSVVKVDGAKQGSEFYVDDFAWSGYVGINDLNGQNIQVSVYPNPASNLVNIEANVDVNSISIVDITGRVIGTYDMFDNKVTIPTENYASGIYFYNLMNEDKEIINRDKFEVLR